MKEAVLADTRILRDRDMSANHVFVKVRAQFVWWTQSARSQEGWKRYKTDDDNIQALYNRTLINYLGVVVE